MEPLILKRGKTTYLVYEDRVNVSVNDQWLSYNAYENWNKAGLTRFISTIKKSKEHEYTTAPDFMSLALRCGVKGVGCNKPRGLDEAI